MKSEKSYVFRASVLPLALIIALISYGIGDRVDVPALEQDPEIESQAEEIVDEWNEVRGLKESEERFIPLGLIASLIDHSLGNEVEVKTPADDPVIGNFISEKVTQWSDFQREHQARKTAQQQAESRGESSNASSDTGDRSSRTDNSSSGQSSGTNQGNDGTDSTSQSNDSNGSTDSTEEDNSSTADNSSSGSGSNFVTTSGSDFILNGQEFRFAGTNSYHLPNYEELDDRVVDRQFDAIQEAGLNVVRMWGFYDGYDCGYSAQDSSETVIQTAPGEYSETALQALDRVVAKAQEHNTRLILSLVNYWDDLGGICQYNTWAGASNPSQNLEFFIDNDQTQQWYKDYISMLLNRTNTETGEKYKNDPTIMAWEIMNEGHLSAEGSDPTKLRNWYQDIAQYIKSIDSNHLVTTGSEGYEVGQNDSDSLYTVDDYSNTFVLRTGWGTSYAENVAIPEIDFGQFHWYPSNFGFGYASSESGMQNLLTAQEAWIKDHVRIAADNNKPTVLGEFGFPGYGDERQSRIYNDVWQLAEETNLAGDLIWQYTADYVKCWEYGGNICWPAGRGDEQLANDLQAHAAAMFSGDASDSGGSSDTGTDTTNPSVSVSHSPTSPTDDETTNIEATASDNESVAKITLEIDGAAVKKCNSSGSCSYSKKFSSGDHTYKAIAEDSSGNTRSQSGTVSVSAASSGGGSDSGSTSSGLSQDLVLFYQFDEGSGSVVNDVSDSSNTHDGEIVGGGSWTTVDGSSVWQSEPGVADYIEIPDHSDLGIPDGQNFSVGIFFAYTENNNAWNTVLDKGYWPGFSIRNAGWNNSWKFQITNNSPTASLSTLKDGSIHQLVASYDQSAKTIDVYVDGVKKSSLSYDADSSSDGSGNLLLAGDGSGDYTLSINRFGVWNRTLSQSEVADWYENKDAPVGR